MNCNQQKIYLGKNYFPNFFFNVIFFVVVVSIEKLLLILSYH